MVRHVLLLCVYPVMAIILSAGCGGGVGVGAFLFADDETARYLCGDQNVAQMIQALQAARARRPEATFNERVKEAWESMRVQASLDSKT